MLEEHTELQAATAEPIPADRGTLEAMHAERGAKKLDKKMRDLEKEHRMLEETKAQLVLRTRRLEVLNALPKLSLEDTTRKAQLERALDDILSVGWMPLTQKGGIWLVEEEPEVLVLQCQKNLPEPLQTLCARVAFGHCLCGRAAAEGIAVHAACVDHRHETRYEGIVPHGHSCMPTVSRGKVLGVIVLCVPDGHRHSAEEEAFLESAADALAGAIERKRVNDAWHESEARVRRLLDSTGAGIYALDPDANCALANSARLNLLGYGDASEILGKKVYELMHHMRPDGSPYPISECRVCRAFVNGRATHVDDEVFPARRSTSP